MVKYVLIEWGGKEEVVFEDDLVDVGKIDGLTDKVLMNLSQILNEAKRANPSGYYLQIAPKRSRNGAEIRVLRDGFNLLKDNFKSFAMGLLDEYQESRIRNPGRRR